jgi:hypothetical protein
MNRVIRVIAALLFCVCGLRGAVDDTPAWLRALAAEKLPAYGAKVPAVILLREKDIAVEETGRIVTTERFAVRVLNRAGAQEAEAVQVYLRDSGKVRDLKAWVISPSGDAHKLAKERYVDIALREDALYDDYRARIASATKECDPGAVFGYESVVEEKSVFTQLSFEFGDRVPVRVARMSLSLPAGWTAKGITLNHAPVEAAESGNGRTWELHDLPFYEPEPASPNFRSMQPRLAISFFPAAGGSATGPSFAKWDDVSRWLSQLHDPQSMPDEAIAAKVRILTANATTAEQKIRALAEYVQNIRYVEIETGTGSGGGYRPHAASVVFAKSYGDCKDKANLLRAMLRAVGIESWPVSIFSGDPLYVREEWPSPQQFNHCILAIRAPEGYVGDAVVDDPRLGRLLLFDATDAYTPLGTLPLHEQNSLALIMAGDKGGLDRMPPAQAASNSTTRKIDATVDATGAVKGTLHEELTGWTAAIQRAYYREQGGPEYRKRVESRVTNGIRGAVISELKTSDSQRDSRFQLDTQFSSPSFAQIMQGRLMVLRPSVLQPVDPLPFNDPARKYPAVVAARSWSDTVRVQLPAGFEVDEIPDAAKIESAFGSYQSVSKVENGVLTFTRTLVLKPSVVPVEDYAKLKKFADQVGGADQAPLVLARK